jgi:hypothetical protein
MEKGYAIPTQRCSFTTSGIYSDNHFSRFYAIKTYNKIVIDKISSALFGVHHNTLQSH